MKVSTQFKAAVIACAIVVFFVVFYWYESIPPTEEQRAFIEATLPEGMKFEDVQYYLFWAVVAWTGYVLIVTTLFYLLTEGVSQNEQNNL